MVVSRARLERPWVLAWLDNGNHDDALMPDSAPLPCTLWPRASLGITAYETTHRLAAKALTAPVLSAHVGGLTGAPSSAVDGQSPAAGYLHCRDVRQRRRRHSRWLTDSHAAQPRAGGRATPDALAAHSVELTLMSRRSRGS
jgi:hypothetical protein